MKSLTLVRHANAVKGSAFMNDFDRPLSEAGRQDAATMGQRLAKYISGHRPIQQVFSSTAERAFSTACIIFQELGVSEQQILAETDLYTFDMEDLYRFIEGIDDSLRSVALVGHNPAMTLLANDLTCSNIANIPTSGIVSIELDIEEWVAVKPGAGKLLSIDHP
jgi:phosphohistidine phosphatase